MAVRDGEPGGLVKLVARNHQYLGVNNALARLQEVQRGGDEPAAPAAKLGVFWHTQGSGKTVSMIFFTQKVLRTMPGNWTFVVVTDRGRVTLDAGEVHLSGSEN